MPYPHKPYDPTEFLTKTAEKLVKIVKDNGDDIAVEMVTLQLKLSYEKGHREGLQQGLNTRLPAQPRRRSGGS